MSDFLDILKEKIIERAMTLPYSEGTERLVTIQCTEAYKNKLENEITNAAIRSVKYSNHSEISAEYQICGIWIRLQVDKAYFKPRLKVSYYDKGSKED